MIEALFRGKRSDNGAWVQGSLLSFKDGRKAIIPSSAKVFMQQGTTTICCNECYDIDNSTTGRCTGLTDKNGKKVFDGDVLKWDEKEWGGPFLEVVKWDYGQFDMRRNDWPKFCEVIGNIFDNPELLEGGDTIATKEERI